MFINISKILVLILIVFGLATAGYLTYGTQEVSAKNGKPGVSKPIKPSHPIKPVSGPIR